MAHNIIYLLVFVFCAFISAMFSGSETGVYQLSRVRLRLGTEQKRFRYMILGKSLSDGPGLLVSLLLGNNLANYFATTSLTYLLLLYADYEQRAAVLATIFITPTFFVFCELIPKNLFFYRADDLMPAISPIIFVFDKAARLTGITAILKKLSRLGRFKSSEEVTGATSLSTSRGHFETILLETHEEGMLSNTQAEMVRRLGRISEVPLGTVMTPVTNVRVIDINSSRADLLEICGKYPFARYPVYDGQEANIIGIIDIYNCLTSEKEFTDLREMLKPVHRMSADMKVMNAIEIMQAENEKMALVTSGNQGRVVGIVTMKDLVEELLGELAEW
ncbi:MAG: CNNM domain-containing protein [Phycisphaerae bacterium]